ncbi:MAG: hypothetical protein IJ795_02025 [Bacteroidales bacterium]|nr:hypothetical protein [Bacteroidales bacterium]
MSSQSNNDKGSSRPAINTILLGVIAIGVLILLFRGKSCSSGNETPSVKQGNDSQIELVCPECYGTGKTALAEDIMASQYFSSCSLCGGKGKVSKSLFDWWVGMHPSSGGGGKSVGRGKSGNQRECYDCYGRGKCNMCAGRGHREHYNSYSGEYVHYDCSACNGRGICLTCHGRGYLR